MSEKSQIIAKMQGGGLLSTNELQTLFAANESGHADPVGVDISPDALGTGAGRLAGDMVGLGMGYAGYGGVPGSGVIEGAVTSGIPGMISGFRSDLAGMLGMPGMAMNTAIGVATSPEPARATTVTGFGMLGATMGSAFGGPLGGWVGGRAGAALGEAAYGSFTDGMIGDAMNTRSYESVRDMMEDSGSSRKDTAGWAKSVDDAAKRDPDALSRASGYSAPANVSQEGIGTKSERDFGPSNSVSSPGNLGVGTERADGSVHDQSAGRLGSSAAAGFGGGGGDSDDGGGWGGDNNDAGGGEGIY